MRIVVLLLQADGDRNGTALASIDSERTAKDVVLVVADRAALNLDGRVAGRRYVNATAGAVDCMVAVNLAAKHGHVSVADGNSSAVFGRRVAGHRCTGKRHQAAVDVNTTAILRGRILVDGAD